MPRYFVEKGPVVENPLVFGIFGNIKKNVDYSGGSCSAVALSGENNRVGFERRMAFQKSENNTDKVRRIGKNIEVGARKICASFVLIVRIIGNSVRKTCLASIDVKQISELSPA